MTDIQELKIKELEQELKFHKCWPDGSTHREQWMTHVWYHIPLWIISQACIVAAEDKGPHFLKFMEPEGWTPKADFTCWICGLALPHPHSDMEIGAARKTLEVFHENVWKHLCEWQKGQ